MKKLLIFPVFAALVGAVASCSSMKPDGALKDVTEGDLFAGPDPVVPPDNKTIPAPKKPPLRWKIALDDH